MSNKIALVVDDSKVARVTLKKKLEQLGVTVELSETASEAFDFLHHHMPDVIFMDHLMPEIDGFEATTRLKADPLTSHIPIIICSGRDDQEYIDLARSIGADDAILKPPSVDILNSILNSLPERAEAEPGAAPVEPAEAAAEAPAATEAQPAPSLLPELAFEPAAAFDEAEVRALIEQELAVREELRRQETDAELARLRSNVVEDVTTTVDNLFDALQQRVSALESAAPAAVAPDTEALLASLDERVTRRLDEFQESLRARLSEPSAAAIVEPLRQELAGEQARLREDAAQWAARLEEISARLDHVAASGDAARTGNQERWAILEQRLDAVERAEPVKALDPATLLAAADERIAAAEERVVARTGELASELQAQGKRLEAANESWSERIDRVNQSIDRLADLNRSAAEAADHRLAEIHDRLHALESAEPPPPPDIGAIIAAADSRAAERVAELRTRVQQESPAPLVAQLQARIEEQWSRYGESLERWKQRFDALTEEMAQLSDAALSSEASHDQRFDAMQKRLSSIEAGTPVPTGHAMDAILEAANEHLAPALAEVRQQLESGFAQQAPLLEQLGQRLDSEVEEFRAVVSGLQADVADRFDAERAETNSRMKTLGARLEALETAEPPDLAGVLATAQGEASALVEALAGQVRQQIRDASPEPAIAQLRDELGDELDAQRAQAEVNAERWNERLDELAQRIEQLASDGLEKGVTQILEERIAQMREVVAIALQPQYAEGVVPTEPRRGAIYEHEPLPPPPPPPPAQIEPAARAMIESIDRNLLELRERMGEEHLRRLMNEAVAAARPAGESAEVWNERLRAETARLEGRIKTLTMSLWFGVACAAAIGALALIR